MLYLAAFRHPAGIPSASVLPATVWPVAGWTTLKSATLLPEPDAAPEQPQPAVDVPAEAAAPLVPGSLRLGNYTVGETNCPALYGHPDIRY